MSDDLLENLRAYADWIEPKCFMSQDDLRALVRRAINRIQHLESVAGAVSAGNGDFRAVKALLPHAGTTGYPSAYGSLEAIPIGYPDDKPNTGC